MTPDLTKLVRPLVFTENFYGDAKSWLADTMYGRFCYGVDFSGKAYSQTPKGEKDHDTLEMALAYVHSQYAARVIAALDAELLAEVVGFLGKVSDGSPKDYTGNDLEARAILAKLIP